MAENGRLNKFEDVADSFETIMRAHRGEIFVQITSAEVFIFFFNFRADSVYALLWESILIFLANSTVSVLRTIWKVFLIHKVKI